MASNHIHRDDGGRRRGFTLVECLIGLAISAALLAAVAVAFNASLNNYRANERMYLSTNNARQALSRMTSQIRTASPAPLSVPSWAVDPNEPETRCSLHTPENQPITFEFRSADKKVYLISGGQSYVLCHNVVAASFVKMPTSNGRDSKSVQISLTVEEGGVRQTLTAAAVVRRNLGSES